MADKFGKNDDWTEEETAYLLKHNIELSRSQIAKNLNKTRNAVCAKAHRLGLTKRTPSEAATIAQRVRTAAKARAEKRRAARAIKNAKRQPTEVEIRRQLTATPVRVDPSSPEARAAAAILSNAQSAERRREGYRERGVR